VAIIMDGNGRWAKQRKLPRIEGHRAGTKSVREVIESSRKLGISILTLYTFSIENWQRPAKEVRELMRLLGLYLKSEIPRLRRNSIRLRAIGQLERLPKKVRAQLDRAREETAGNDSLTLVLALSYGGRAEILDAVKSIARERAAGGGDTSPLTPERFARHLYAPDIPPPDLLIRTSGEMRLSNFLLWEAARARLWFAPELWPEFRGPQFEKVIAEARDQLSAAGAPS
jgi:undecaprenyl diphosphate synthase